MAFKKAVSVSDAIDGGGPDEEPILAAPEAELVAQVSEVSADETLKDEAGGDLDSAPEVGEPELEASEAKKESDEVIEEVSELDNALLAGQGMELSEEALEAPVSSSLGATGATRPAPTRSSKPAARIASDADGAPQEAPEAEVAAEDGPGAFASEPEPDVAPSSRIVGNGSALPPSAQREQAIKERAAMTPSYGGGGGLGSIFAATGAGLAKGGKLLGRGAMALGGQRLADRFLEPSDPVSIANRARRQRYGSFNGALKELDVAANDHASSIDRFNDMVLSSDAGRTLKKMADAEKADLYDFMSDVKSGKNANPVALNCMENLEADPKFGQAAKDIVSAQNRITKAGETAATNLESLTADHAADINTTFEHNRLVEKIEKVAKADKKPLPLEATLQDQESPETKIDTEKQHKKFLEALDKIKEAIAALLSKIMSKLGMGGAR